MTEDYRSNCPIACTLDLIGDRWTLLVLRDLFLGKTRYDEFLASPEKIATNILADRLRRLETLGMLQKQPYGSHRKRMEYRLTGRGRSLLPVLQAIVSWGQENIPGTVRLEPHSSPSQ
jgi:DNA-binding HxlR family transcriptional regulator